MARMRLLSSIVFFTVALMGAETVEERYENVVLSTVESVVALTEAVSNFGLQVSQISTTLLDVKLRLQEVENSVRSFEKRIEDRDTDTKHSLQEIENSVRSLEKRIEDHDTDTKNSVKSLEQEIVDLTAEKDEQVSNLTSSLSVMRGKVEDLGVVKEGEVMIVSGEQPAGGETCMKVCAGTTGRSTTDWTDYSSDGLYEDVDISGCGFTTVPTVTTSLEGTSAHWNALGTSSIYSVTTTTFRIYIQASYGIRNNGAESRKWNVEWIAVGYTC